MKPGEIVLVAFSGGPSSTAMLHMIQQGLKETSHKRILFKPAIIHIHDSSRDECPLEELKPILKAALLADFPFYITSLELAFQENCELFKKVQSIEEALDFLSSVQMKAPQLRTATSVEDFTTIVRKNLLGRVSSTIGCDKVFTGESSMRLAIQLLSCVAVGRGNQIPNLIGFEDPRYTVPILRPLREFSMEEITLYNQLNGLETFIKNRQVCAPSIQNTTEDFVKNLQSQFCSTVPTICRTGDKICSTAPGEDSASSLRCTLCKSDLPANKTSGALRSLIGQNVDHSLSDSVCYACCCLIQNTTDPEGKILLEEALHAQPS